MGLSLGLRMMNEEAESEYPRWITKPKNFTMKSFRWKVSRYLTHTPYQMKTGLTMSQSGQLYCMEMYTITLLSLRVVIHNNH